MLKRSLAVLLIILTCLSVFPFAVNAAANGTGFYQVTASSLNVRAEANAQSQIVSSLSNGDLITVTQISGSWGKTIVNSVTGWVSLNYCSRLFYITFDANGGKGAPDAMLIADGGSIAVPGEVPVIPGKTFKGWSTSLANANAGIVSYSAKGSLGGSSYLAPSSDMTLYACWAEKTVSDPETGGNTDSTINPKLSGETSRVVKELYDGVTSTKIKTSSSSKYDLQSFNVVEFDLSQTDLYLDVTNTRTYANQLKTVSNTVSSFNSSNGDGKKAIAAVNGDLWMTTYAHSRVQGSGTSYGGYSDAVVTSGLTLPRGFNVYDGEIICSAYMQQETPYEGEFWSFGITDDFVPMIGCPELEIKITDTTKSLSASADGLNRLPANNALVVYSDKGCLNNYALSDAYEIAIDCNYDYTVAHGTKITGKISGIYSSSSSSNPTMKANRIILTARGSAVSLINKFAVGDTVTLDFSVTERYGRNTEGWQNVTNAVGGHMPFVVDGVKRETGTTTNYPTTIIGIKNDGSLCFIANDGRQSSFSTGLDFNMYWDLADDFDLNTAFILDGGGSTTMVELAGSGYNLVNSPSDGSERTVVNSVILSYGPKRKAQGDFDVKLPDANVDLTKLFFATDEGYALIAGQNESISSQTASGVRLTVKDFYSAPGVVISYGLPNTSSYNPNSVLADIEYPTVDASNYPYVVFDMSVVSADKSLVQFQTLYTTTGSRKGISQDTFIGFNNAYNNNGYKLYTLNPGANATFKGRLNSFHFGFFFPANGVTVKDGDYIILRSVRLAKTANEAASMTAVNASTVKFNANGGSVDRSLKYVMNGGTYGKLPVPTREGYTFDGWYTATTGGTEITADSKVNHTGIKNLYAHWISSHTHTFGAWSVKTPATCVIDGEESRACSGCGVTEIREIPATGKHSFGDWVTVKDARCESDGEERRFCDDCDESVIRTIPAPGHAWGEWTVISYAHCATEGAEALFCDNCDEMQTRVIPAPGHVWAEEEIVSHPGCESSGTVIHYCAHCDDILEEILDPTGHNFGDWIETKPAGCTEPGVNTRTCTKCKKSQTETIPETGHDYHTELTDPTCTEKGYITHTCDNCGDSYKDNYSEAKGHSYGQWAVAEHPTCVLEGTETRSCINCDSTETKSIPAKGHKYESDVVLPTCTDDGYTVYTCHCGHSYTDSVTPATGHDFDDWKIIVAAGCETDGEEKRICKNCDHFETQTVPAKGHSMGEWSMTTAPTCEYAGEYRRTCINCDVFESREVAPIDHTEIHVDAKDATCVENGNIEYYYCSVCGYHRTPDGKLTNAKNVIIPATGKHSFGEWNTVKPALCEVDGREERFCNTCEIAESRPVPSLGHDLVHHEANYENCPGAGWDAYDTCTRCDYSTFVEIPTLGHSYLSEVIEPTCTEKGYTQYTCKNCGNGYKDNYVDEKGHDFGEWEITVAAGCESDGEEKRICKNCDHVEIQTIPAKGHNMGEWIVTTDPTCDVDGTETRYCENCDATETQIVPAKGHVYESDVVLPTCTDDGYTVHTCHCGHSYTDSVTPAAGHDFDEWKITVAVGCETDGEEKRICKNCDHFETQTISATGHKMGEWIVTTDPTCVLDGAESKYCANCDHVETQVIPATGHKYESAVVLPTCTDDGYTIHTCHCGHSYTDSVTPAVGHDFDEWKITVTAGCETDGEEKRICKNCDHFETQTIPATGHNMGEWIVTINPTCVLDGIESKYCANCDHVETQAIPATGHKYESDVVLPTCTDDGYTVHTCHCGHSYTDSVTPATGHDFDEWKIPVTAGCETDGEEKRICKNCDHFEAQTIPATGHNMGEWIVTTDPTCVLDGIESKYCANCDHFETQTISATGMHSFGEWRVTVEPTVFADGERSRKCADCDAIETEAVAKLNMTNPFTDVKEDKWYTEGILYCYHKGYMAGVSETLFDYKGSVTRAMFVTILSKIDGADISSYTDMSFIDVKPGQWYSAAIEWAASNGYAAGLGEGIFGYKQNVSREQLAMFLYTYSAKNGIDVSAEADLSAYVDHSRIHSWALDALEWAVSEALISGTSDTTLSPRDSATRAEIALIVMNYVENIKTSGI